MNFLAVDCVVLLPHCMCSNDNTLWNVMQDNISKILTDLDFWHKSSLQVITEVEAEHTHTLIQTQTT